LTACFVNWTIKNNSVNTFLHNSRGGMRLEVIRKFFACVFPVVFAYSLSTDFRLTPLIIIVCMGPEVLVMQKKIMVT